MLYKQLSLLCGYIFFCWYVEFCKQRYTTMMWGEGEMGRGKQLYSYIQRWAAMLILAALFFGDDAFMCIGLLYPPEC